MGITGQSYKSNVVVNYNKNGFNKLNFTLNYNNFDGVELDKFYKNDLLIGNNMIEI